MIDDRSQRPRDRYVPRKGTVARLHLNGADVGEVVIGGCDSSYTHGVFTPDPAAFAPFATLFGRWTLLMHEDVNLPLHREASEALSDTEREMDALHARVFYPNDGIWKEIRQLNIDAEVIEWKELL